MNHDNLLTTIEPVRTNRDSALLRGVVALLLRLAAGPVHQRTLLARVARARDPGQFPACRSMVLRRSSHYRHHWRNNGLEELGMPHASTPHFQPRTNHIDGTAHRCPVLDSLVRKTWLITAGILALLGLIRFAEARADTLAVSSMADDKIHYVLPDGSVSPLATIKYYPEGVAFGPGSATIYAANWGGNLIHRISSSGFISSFVTNIVDPYGLAFDSKSNLFVACYQINRVQKISPDRAVTNFATVSGAYGLAIDAADYVYVSGLSSRLSRISPDGSAGPFGPPVDGAQGIAVDAKGHVYVASMNGTIMRIAPSGEGSLFATGLPGTVGLTFDSAGILYAAQYTAGRISKVDTNGVVTSFATLPGAKWIAAYPGRRFKPGAIAIAWTEEVAVVTWTGQFTLQSSSEAGGVYFDLPVARSPYTHAVGVQPQTFFRLRN